MPVPRVTLSAPPMPAMVLKLVSFALYPAATLPKKFGTLNVVLPSPPPYAVLIAVKSAAYVVLLYAVPSHKR